MLLSWLNAKEATRVGATLADEFLRRNPSGDTGSRVREASAAAQGKMLQAFLQHVDRYVASLQLNIFRRAKLANSFKWRLLENGIDRDIANELTQALVLRLTGVGGRPSAGSTQAAPTGRAAILTMLAKADEQLARGATAEAVLTLQEVLAADPRHAGARNQLGAALSALGRYREAEDQFRRAVGIRDNYPEAHCNLGALLRLRGRLAEAETQLRRALKLKPAYIDAQVNLGLTLLGLARLGEAKESLEKALRGSRRNVAALAGTGEIAAAEGHFADAEAIFRSILELDPKMPSALAGLARLRQMTPADAGWLKGAERAAGDLQPLDEASVRYAIGKYYDDTGSYDRAFRSFQRANELRKGIADEYDRTSRGRFVDDLIRVYSREVLAGSHPGASDSIQPVFVVGMMRSGTSLVEQIIASHPHAAGAGELQFWTGAIQKNETSIRREAPGETLRRKLAAAYLRALGEHGGEKLRVVDKATFNADYLGVIHSVFPKARMIYLRRDPRDTCLSCYFQEFSVGRSFTMSLDDLAHYYREHHRLVAHWRSALPEGTLLDVPYEELIADQEGWSRKIIDFLGLEWDTRCLDFDRTQRPVLTASNWQVRQKIYRSSIGRWRNYQSFIEPLLPLADMG